MTAEVERSFRDAATRGDLPGCKRTYRLANSALLSADEQGFTALHCASANNHVVVVQWLLGLGAELAASSIFGWRPMHEACYHGCIECARALHDAGGALDDATLVGSTPLHLASFGGHLDLVSWLLEGGASNSADSDNRDVLHYAAAGGHKELSAWLQARLGLEFADSTTRVEHVLALSLADLGASVRSL